MILKTFDTILTELCDNFDSLISPTKITRSNSNVIYLLFKAIAKGEEVINNLSVTLSHKFDPAFCSVEDLDSVSRLVGTKKLLGSASGLNVTVRNNSRSPVTLLAGTYKYEFNSDIIFLYNNATDVVLSPGRTETQFFFSTKVGNYPVSAQSQLPITAYQEVKEGDKVIDTIPVIIPGDVTFSCVGNNALLGLPEESDLAFRERILTDTQRQSSISAIELAIKNLPYIFDCNVVFNQTQNNLQYDTYSIAPYHMLVVIAGDARDEIAKIIASHGIYPTHKGSKFIELKYMDNVFVPPAGEDKGYYPVYVHKYETLDFKLQIQYDIDETYTTFEKVKPIIEGALLAANANVHEDLVSEDKYYKIINDLHIVGFKLLCVNLLDLMGDKQEYLLVPKTRIAKLNENISWIPLSGE